MNKKFFTITLVITCILSFSFGKDRMNISTYALSDYFGKTFHGNMMGKIITADMTIVDDEKIEFAVNLPYGKKNHIYSYKIIDEVDSKIVAEWYENEKLEKLVTFSDFMTDSFKMELKGKGKITMQELK